MTDSRRDFIKKAGLLTLATGVFGDLFSQSFGDKAWFEISLAEWSLHRKLRKGDLNNMGFPAYVQSNFGINAVEYVNTFFKDKAQDQVYLKELLSRTQDLGVRNVLIMVDGEGDLGDANANNRVSTVDNHKKWIEAAHYLGCSSIRVNAAGEGSKTEVAQRVVESLSQLAHFAKGSNINVVVENHGGISSHGDWLSDVLGRVGLDNCGSLPDFGNFYEYDAYQGVGDLMPFAKGVSAKTFAFDENGLETKIDYHRMMKLVKEAGYAGYIGIEYEGDGLSEDEGILKTKALLEKFRG